MEVTNHVVGGVSARIKVIAVSEDKISVVIVDDESLLRSGFEMILDAAGDIDVLATTSGAQALAEITRHRPDVVLLDIRMPDVDGLAVLREIQALNDPPVVTMLTAFAADEYVAEALRVGAAGFIVKDTDPVQLIQQVRALAGGSVVLSPQTTRAVLDSAVPSASAADLALVGELNVRERDVLRLMAKGLSNTEIGARLHLSVGSIKDHVRAILTKLAVANRVQAALVAQRAGLLTDQDDTGGKQP